jgi:ribosomal protein L35AE/L33A
MIDVTDVLASERILVDSVESGAGRLLVGTVSHCHGALGVLAVRSLPQTPN